MISLLGWTLLLLFGESVTEALNRKRNGVIGERRTSIFTVSNFRSDTTNNQMITSSSDHTRGTNLMLLDTTTIRNDNTESKMPTPHIQTTVNNFVISDTDTTTIIGRVKDTNNKRKNRFENKRPELNAETDSNAERENRRFKDEIVEQSRGPANRSDLVDQRQVSTTLSIRAIRRRNGIGRNVDVSNLLCNERRGNESDNCTSDSATSGEDRVFPLIIVKYATQAFPFLVNVLSIVFHCRRQGKTNVVMYVIAMNCTELVSVLLGFSWGMIHKSPLAGIRTDKNRVITTNLMHYIDSWAKQGSYVVHLLLTIERFQVVKYPMHYTHLWNVTKGKHVLSATILAFLVSHTIGITVSSILRDTYDRTLFYEWNVTSGVIFMLVPVIAIVILNSSTAIVFYMENSRIRESCKGPTLEQVLKREKKLITRLGITTTILIMTSVPLSLFELFLGKTEGPNLTRKFIGEGFSALSYFGNGVAFVILMALSVSDRERGCSLCCVSEESQSATLQRADTQCVSTPAM